MDWTWAGEGVAELADSGVVSFWRSRQPRGCLHRGTTYSSERRYMSLEVFKEEVELRGWKCVDAFAQDVVGIGIGDELIQRVRNHLKQRSPLFYRGDLKRLLNAPTAELVEG
jgi:hypothetical protein